MKKLVFSLLILGISLSVFAQLNEKDVIGEWKYTVQTDEGQLTGILKFETKDGKLSGVVKTNEGDTFPLNKIELKEQNTLYFELQPDYDIIKVTVIIEGDSFKGNGSTTQGQFGITGNKKVQP